MKKITIGGKEYEACLTGGCLLRFKRAAGFDFLKDPQKVDSESLLILAWAALKSTAALDGQEFDMTVEQMADRMSLAECNGLAEWLKEATAPEGCDVDFKKKRGTVRHR